MMIKTRRTCRRKNDNNMIDFEHIRDKTMNDFLELKCKNEVYVWDIYIN